MNRQLRNHIWALVDYLSNDIALNDQTRGEDTEHIGKILAAAQALLKSLVNPPITVIESTEGDQITHIDTPETGADTP